MMPYEEHRAVRPFEWISLFAGYIRKERLSLQLFLNFMNEHFGYEIRQFFFRIYNNQNVNIFIYQCNYNYKCRLMDIICVNICFRLV